jgi:hypothetical protein
MKVLNRHTLTLITTAGEIVPIGIGGAPKFHVFKGWTRAHRAIANVVATLGLDNVLTIAQTCVVRRGADVDFTVTHLTRGHIEELCTSVQIVGHRTKRSDGRSVRVSVPVDVDADVDADVDDYGDPSPSDGQL